MSVGGAGPERSWTDLLGETLLAAGAAAQPAPSPAPAPAPAPARPLPDAIGIAGDMSVRYEALNRRINAGYAEYATRLQEIVDPGFAARGTSRAYPNWFAFAPYASREVGRGMHTASAALEAIRDVRRSGGGGAEPLREMVPGMSSAEAAGLLGALERVLPTMRDDALTIGAFLFGLATKSPGDLGVLADPRTLAISARRLVALLETAPGRSVDEKLEAIAGTLRNALEAGNRAIFGDIGGAAQRYFEWRDRFPGGAPSPEDVIRDFRVPGTTRPEQARQIYDAAVGAAARGGLGALQVERRFPSPPFDLRNAVAAGFALFEQAGRTPEPARKNELISFANNLLASREQRDPASKAFLSSTTQPGEVDRAKVFELMTPMVSLPAGGESWSFADFADERLPARDLNPLTPRVTEYNWARFEDRWDGILAAFASVYPRPAVIWPMPAPDPLVG